VEEDLTALAPGVPVLTGAVAIRAALDAEEEALATVHRFPGDAFDLAVQRTRALIAVDIDYAHLAGRVAHKGREGANREGLAQAARLIRLKSWGGLVAVDLVGTAFDSATITAMARAAFGPEATIGPVSRFGMLQLSLPWRRRPIEEVLLNPGGHPTAATRAIHLTRRLRLALLADTASPRLTARCAPDDGAAATGLIARLGPRAALRIDPALAPGRFVIEQD
jgi:hypothetical protein